MNEKFQAVKETNLELFDPKWAGLSDEELLSMRICDLKLKIDGSEIEFYVRQFSQELKDKGLTFFPKCYLADEWFCPDGVPIIAIPFYLAHPRLKQLEHKMVLEVEGGTKDSCLRLLRHEGGHAINYAFKLHRRKKWRELFGDFSNEYPDTYRPLPYSKRFVRHLENWYAQYHPDEDFAETFAVWLDPSSNWRKKYQGWRAMEKLLYVDRLMDKVRERTPIVTGGAKMCEASRLTQKLTTYYSRKRKAYAEDMPSFYDSDLRRIFAEAAAGEKPDSAALFLNRHRRAIVNGVSRWTGERKFTISRLLKNLITRCQEIKLFRRDDEAYSLLQVTAFLTQMVMNYLFTGKLKRHP